VAYEVAEDMEDNSDHNLIHMLINIEMLEIEPVRRRN
jgi:hypothetical protein